jgi:calcineurin-like phosphoesterase
MPTRFPIANGAVKLCGVIIEADTVSGRCLKIGRFAETYGDVQLKMVAENAGNPSE